MSKDKATLPDTRCGSLPWWLEAEPPAHRHCSTAHQQPALVVWQDFRSVRNTPHHQMVISYRLFSDQGKHTDSDSSPSQQTIPPWAFQLPFRCKSTESLPFPKTLPLWLVFNLKLTIFFWNTFFSDWQYLLKIEKTLKCTCIDLSVTQSWFLVLSGFYKLLVKSKFPNI